MKAKRILMLTTLVMITALLVSGTATANSLLSKHDSVVTTKTLVKGASLHGANGLYFGPDGRLYIASFAGREIVVMDPNSGRILDRMGPERGVEGPDDLTFGPDGSLYWTVITTGEVGKRAPDGTKSTVAHLPPGANPITFSDDGRLFVALDFLGDALYELDPSGHNPPRLILENLGFLNGFDWGPDDWLYGPIFTAGKVVRINVDTGDVETVADGFAVPAAAKFDSQGRLHVLDQWTGEVVRVDIQTGAKQVIARLEPGLDNLAFDPHDHLFVSSADSGWIVEALPNGRPRPVSRGGMIAPGGVAVLPNSKGHERVFVADLWSLREFNGRTGQPLSWDSTDIGSALTVAPDGDRLVVTTWLNNAVQVWDPVEQKFLEEYYDFAAPLNAIRFQGDLIVAELGTGRVVRMDADTHERVTLAQLAVPTGLAATEDDLWVGDWAMGMVWQVVADGTPLPQPIPVATGLSFPEGLAVAPDGNLLVVETGTGRLLRIDLMTGEVSAVAEGLELGAPSPAGVPPTWIFNGVAVGPSGAIYVTGDKTNVLYRLKLRP
jgi:sugar lactone lactonase YvrE